MKTLTREQQIEALILQQGWALEQEDYQLASDIEAQLDSL